ncbi:MAG: ribosome maturation factor RimP [Mycoplasmatales bacterium]
MDLNKELFSKVDKLIKNYTLYDIEEDTFDDKKVIRILIQKEDNSAVDIDDCVKVSNLIDDKLDNDFDQEFILEVSSSGIIRDLKYPFHYKQVIGETILLNDSEVILKDVLEDRIVLTSREILFKDIKNAKTTYKFKEEKND